MINLIASHARVVVPRSARAPRLRAWPRPQVQNGMLRAHMRERERRAWSRLLIKHGTCRAHTVDHLFLGARATYTWARSSTVSNTKTTSTAANVPGELLCDMATRQKVPAACTMLVQMSVRVTLFGAPPQKEGFRVRHGSGKWLALGQPGGVGRGQGSCVRHGRGRSLALGQATRWCATLHRA